MLTLTSTQRGNELVRAFTQFQSDPIKTLNLIYEFGRGWKEKTAREKISLAFMGMVVPALVTQIIQSGGNRNPLNDPEGYARTMVNSVSGGIPLLGMMLDAGTGWLADEIYKARGGIPDRKWTQYISNLTPTSISAYSDLLKATADSSDDKLLKIARATAALTGAPWLAVERAVKNGKKVAYTGDWRYVFWSEEALKPHGIEFDMLKRATKPADWQQLIPLIKWYDRLNDDKKQAFLLQVARALHYPGADAAEGVMHKIHETLLHEGELIQGKIKKLDGRYGAGLLDKDEYETTMEKLKKELSVYMRKRGEIPKLPDEPTYNFPVGDGAPEDTLNGTTGD